MATITDLTGNEVIESDISVITSSGETVDSNINAYAFANVLLAGLLPTVIILINTAADLFGSLVSESDIDGQSLTESDISGDSVSAEDKYGSSVSETDMGDVVLLVTDFLSTLNIAMDIGGTSLSVSEWGGSLSTGSDVTTNNYEFYDCAGFTYNSSSVYYNGLRLQGVVVDISGS